jgi:hypothetical protein
VPQLQLLQQIGSANDYFNHSSRLETSRERVLNYLVTISAWSTTSWNQLRLVGFVDKSPTDKSYASPPTFRATHTLFIGKLETPNPCQVWSEAVQPRTFSALEEDLDYLLPLGEGEATVRQGAIVSNNYSDSAAHMTRDLVRGLDWSGRFEHQKGMKPSRFLKSSTP